MLATDFPQGFFLFYCFSRALTSENCRKPSFSIGALYSPSSKQLFQSQIVFIFCIIILLFMDINELNAIIKKKICDKVSVEKITIEDKTFLHKNHKSHQADKFHIKITLKSKELSKISKIESTKKIYEILNDEIKNNIHSLQILFN